MTEYIEGFEGKPYARKCAVKECKHPAFIHSIYCWKHKKKKKKNE